MPTSPLPEARECAQVEHALVQPWKSNDSISQRLCKPGQNEAMLGGDELYEKPRMFFLCPSEVCWDSSLLWVLIQFRLLHHTARRIAYVKAEDWSLVIPVIPSRKNILWITIPCRLVDCWARPPWHLCGRAWEIPLMWDIYPAGWQALWQLLVISEPVPEERTLPASLLWVPLVQLRGPFLAHSRAFGNQVFCNSWCELLGIATEMLGRNTVTKQAFYQEALCGRSKKFLLAHLNTKVKIYKLTFVPCWSPD